MVSVATARIFADKESKIKIPKRSETLASWCLPIMSKACEHADAEAEAARKEREAIDTFNWVKNLKEKYEQPA